MELIDRIALIKEELRELIDNAEVEKRSLNDDEKSLFETKENELKDLQVQLRSTEIIEKKIKNFDWLFFFLSDIIGKLTKKRVRVVRRI